MYWTFFKQIYVHKPTSLLEYSEVLICVLSLGTNGQYWPKTILQNVDQIWYDKHSILSLYLLSTVNVLSWVLVVSKSLKVFFVSMWGSGYIFCF